VLSDCAQACAAEADAALAEQDLAEMIKCIRLCLDCTDVCTTILGVVSWRPGADGRSGRAGTANAGWCRRLDAPGYAGQGGDQATAPGW